MKLRLPHKFQAALMAALASVSFTTLSSGTAAYGATTSLDQAELQLVDFTTQSMTDAKTAGWTFSDGFAGSESGVYTAAANTRITSTTPWTSVIKDGTSNRSIWAGIITVNVNTLPTGAQCLLEDASGTNRKEGMGVGTATDGSKYITGVAGTTYDWGHTNNRGMDISLANLADANGNITLGIFYHGTGTKLYVADQQSSNTGLKNGVSDTNLAMYLSSAAGVEYSNLFLFGAESTTEVSDADMKRMMKEAGAYYWKGSTDGNWNAATTNWTHYGSDLAVAIGTGGGNANTNVVFGADASLKTVTLAGATTVGALTVSGGDYTFNLNGNLTTSGITIAQGASLAYAGTGSISGALSGAGTYILPSGTKTLGSVSRGDSWTGAVRISGFSFGGENLANTFTRTGSWVELYGITGGYLAGWNNGSESANIILTDPSSNTVAWKWSDGSSSGETLLTLSGDIKGTGTLFKDTTKFRQGFKFTGDVHGWTGDFRAKATVNDAVTKLEFAGSSGQEGEPYEVNVGNISNEGVAALNVVFSTAGDVSVASNIKKTGTGAVNLTVANGTNATFAGTITNANTLTLAGNSTATFSKAVSAASLAVGDHRSTGATATFNGDLTLSGNLTLNGTQAALASVALNGNTSVGNLDLSNANNAHGTVTLATGKTLNVSGGMWMTTAATLVLAENATFEKGTELSVVGLSNGGSLSNTGSDTYNLNNSGYTLTNVQATIKMASSDVQLRFVNSKLVTDQDITLKNLQSVFSGMEIGGGTTTVGASDAGTVTLGAVTLSNGGNLTLAAPVTGNVSSINVAGTSAISGGTLSMGGTITTGDGAQLTLGGTVLFASGGITSSGNGSLAFDNSVVFDLSQLTEDTATHTYTLFTGNDVDLTSLNTAAANHIAGVVTTGRTWTFNENGQVTYRIDSRDLAWRYGLDVGTWSTSTSDKPWTVKGDPNAQYFSDGDSVSFTEMVAPAVVTLGSNVTAASMTLLDGDVVDVTVNNGGGYTLNVDELDILTGRLTTNTAMNVKSVNIAAGAEWALGYAQDLGAVTTINNNGLLRVLDGVELHVRKGTTAESIGTVTADEGGTLYVENGSGTGVDKYTYHGSADAPFEGTLVYDINSTGGHNTSIALENFQGTLELRGRLDADDSSFGGMTKLVLRGDRANNTTGMWSHGSALTLDADVDIVGDHQVDLYTSSALTINGDINAGGAAGILGKRDGNALNLNGDVNLLGLNIYVNTVNLNGTGKAYNLGAVTLSGGNLTVGEAGSVTAKSVFVADNVAATITLGADMTVSAQGGSADTDGAFYTMGAERTTLVKSASADAVKTLTVQKLDLSNVNTVLELQNVNMVVTGGATVGELQQASTKDNAIMRVGAGATLDLNGGVVWNKADDRPGKETPDFVNLTINNGGTVNVNAGEGNKLNDVTVNAGAKLNFDSDTETEIMGALALADTITNEGSLTIHNGSVAANQVGTLTGNGAYTVKGTVAAAGNLKLDGITVTGEESAAITGNVEIAGGTLAGAITLGSADSTIRVSDVFTAAESSIIAIHGTMVLDDLGGAVTNYTGAQYGGNNGFISGVSLTAYNVGTNATVTFDGSASYKDAAGRIENGVFTSDSGSMTTFIVTEMTGTGVETYSHAKSVGGDHFVNLEMAAGTSFIIDAVDAEMSSLDNIVVHEGATAATIQVDAVTNIISVATGAGLTFTGDSEYFTLGTITGTGLLTIDGPTSTSIMNDNSSFAGGITVNKGYLAVNNVNQLGSGTITANEGGTIQITTNSLPATLTVEGQGDVNLLVNKGGQNVNLKAVEAANLHLVADSDHNSRFVYDAASDLSGVGHLYFDGGQLWLNGKDMTGDNAFAGDVTFNATKYTENGQPILSGAAMRINNSATFNGAVAVDAYTKLAYASNSTVTFGGAVTGSGQLDLKSWSNNSGTLAIAGDASAFTGAVTSDSRITLNVADQASLALGAGSNLAGAVTLDGTMTVAGNSTISGAVSGTGSLVVNGGATLTLGGAGLINVGSLTMNTGSFLDVSNLTQMAGITVNLASYTNSATCTAANITGVNSSLTYKLTDDGSNVTLTFASAPSPTPFKPVVDLGNVMYVGDSITDGESGQKSWRYSFFQVLADGGIGQTEEGYFQHRQTSGAITTTTYGDRTFENNHSAHTSARSKQTVGDSTGRYDNTNIKNWLGISTEKTGGGTYEGPVYKDATAPNTYFVLLGTNDTLSEDGGHMSEAFYNQVIGTMYGYANGEFDGETGTFDKMYAAMMQNNKDAKLVVLEIPTWSPDHRNNNNASDYAYIAKVNQKLHEWADSKHNSNITIVNTNPGILDVANTTKPGAGVATMYADGLHPSAQGELLIAGNVAKQLGYAGRTVGLDRASYSKPGSTTWTPAGDTSITVEAGAEAQTFATGAFNIVDGYTIDFGALYGNGLADGWSDKAYGLSVQVGDGYHTGTLTFSEAYVMWGNTVLYSRDNSQAGDNFRIAYVNQSVDEEDHVSTGYYVWMGDQLIGEALSGVSGSFNGISLTSTGANGTVNNLTWSNTAYAPTTTLFENPNSAERFHLEQANTLPTHDNPEHSSLNIDFTDATPVSKQQFATGGQPAEGKLLAEHTDFGDSWFGPAGHNHTGNIEVEYSGVTSGLNMFGVINAAVTGDVSTVIGGGSTFGKGEYSSSGQCSIIGAFRNGSAATSISGKLSIEINDATMTGHILMGTAAGTASIGATDLRINSGAVVNGNIFGGHHQSTGTTTGDSDITITGGTINGTVYGGNMGNGSIGGNVNITITGGIITGDVNGGGTGGTIAGSTNVTVEGILPSIKGNINAQNVTLKDVATSEEGYADGFDSYKGTITATNFTLDKYTADELLATVTAANLAATNGTETTINHLTTAAGTAISVSADSSLTVGDVKLSAAIANSGEMVLNGNVDLSLLASEQSSRGYKDGDVDGNGFYHYVSTVQVVAVGSTGTFDGSEATMTYNGNGGTVDNESGVFTSDESRDLATFHVFSSSEDYSTAYGIAGAQLTTVKLAGNATTINMNEANVTLATLTLEVGDAGAATVNTTANATISAITGLATGQTLNFTGNSATPAVLTINGDNTGNVLGDVVITGGTVKMGLYKALGAYNHRGANPSTNRTITVGEGGVLDMNGAETGADHGYEITLDGGTLTNTGTARRWSNRQPFTSVVLASDSKAVATSDFGLMASSWGATKLDLQDHVLEVSGAGRFYLSNTTVNAGENGLGTILAKGGTVNFNGNDGNTSRHGSFAGNLVMAADDNGTAGTIAGRLKLGGTTKVSSTVEGDTPAVVTADINTNGQTLRFEGAQDINVAPGTATGDNYNGTAAISGNGTIEHASTGTTTISGSMSNFTGDVDVQAGELNIMNIAQATSLNVADVTISNSTLGVYTNTTAAEANVGTLTIKDSNTLTASGASAKLNANLVMETGSTLDVSAYGGTGGLNMGCSVTLNPGMSLSANDMESVAGLGFMEAYDLYHDVESFFIGNTQYEAITFASETWVKASEIFDNTELDAKDYYVFYSGVNPGGNGGNVGTIYIVQVPEPTTSTLSLLALCALAARRRRK